MIPIESAREAFYAGKRTSLSPFVVNDCVCVPGGDAVGIRGAVISIERIEPECH